MDINTNTLQLQSAVITPLNINKNNSKPVDSLTQPVVDRASKAEAQPIASGESIVDKAKESEDLKQAVSKLNDAIQNMQRNLQFSIDKDSGVMVVKVMDAKSEKVIRQMPTEETLRLARSFTEQEDNATFNIFSSKA